jgi:MFS family permease
VLFRSPLLACVAIDAAGFRAAFAAATAVLTLTFLLTVAIRRGVGAGASQEATAATVRSRDDRSEPHATALPRRYGAREALRNVGVQLAVLSSAGVFVAISVKQAFLPVALQELGYPATTIGALISLTALASVLVRPLMPLFSRTFGGPARTLVVAMAAVAVGVGALGMVSSVVAFGVLAVLAGFGTGIGLPLSIVTVASHVEARHRGSALGLRLSLNRAAQLVMPVAVGGAIGAAGYGFGFGLTGVVLAGLAVAAALRVRAFETYSPS